MVKFRRQQLPEPTGFAERTCIERRKKYYDLILKVLTRNTCIQN